MSGQPNKFELPELTIWDADLENDFTIVGDYDRSSSRKSTNQSRSNVSGFVSKLANVCAASDKDNLVENLVKQTCGVAGFGPMVSALEKFRA